MPRPTVFIWPLIVGITSFAASRGTDGAPKALMAAYAVVALLLLAHGSWVHLRVGRLFGALAVALLVCAVLPMLWESELDGMAGMLPYVSAALMLGVVVLDAVGLIVVGRLRAD